jgi:hypothetical protein
MLRRSAAVIAVLAAMFASPLSGQETKASAKIAGKWEFTIDGPQGPDVMTITMTQAGDTLTGTAESQFGTLPLSKGKISGENFSFALTMNGNGEAMELPFSGKVTGETAEGRISVAMDGGMVINWRAKKVPN